MSTTSSPLRPARSFDMHSTTTLESPPAYVPPTPTASPPKYPSNKYTAPMTLTTFLSVAPALTAFILLLLILTAGPSTLASYTILRVSIDSTTISLYLTSVWAGNAYASTRGGSAQRGANIHFDAFKTYLAVLKENNKKPYDTTTALGRSREEYNTYNALATGKYEPTATFASLPPFTLLLLSALLSAAVVVLWILIRSRTVRPRATHIALRGAALVALALATVFSVASAIYIGAKAGKVALQLNRQVSGWETSASVGGKFSGLVAGVVVCQGCAFVGTAVYWWLEGGEEGWKRECEGIGRKEAGVDAENVDVVVDVERVVGTPPYYAILPPRTVRGQ